MTVPRLTPVKSSNLDAIGHDGQHLFVRFKDGMTYRHAEVPAEVYLEMREAESVGKFYHARIKGRFESQRLPVDKDE